MKACRGAPVELWGEADQGSFQPSLNNVRSESGRHKLSRFANIDSRIRSINPVPLVVSGSGVNRPAGKV